MSNPFNSLSHPLQLWAGSCAICFMVSWSNCYPNTQWSDCHGSIPTSTMNVCILTLSILFRSNLIVVYRGNNMNSLLHSRWYHFMLIPVKGEYIKQFNLDHSFLGLHDFPFIHWPGRQILYAVTSFFGSICLKMWYTTIFLYKNI